MSRDGHRLGVDYGKSPETVFTEVLNVVYNAQDLARHMTAWFENVLRAAFGFGALTRAEVNFISACSSQWITCVSCPSPHSVDRPFFALIHLLMTVICWLKSFIRVCNSSPTSCTPRRWNGSLELSRTMTIIF
jgi:hypothetical protein